MLDTALNVAIGSALKVGGHAISTLISGFFRTQELAILKDDKAAQRRAMLYGGVDTAGPFARATRRGIAWAFTATACFVIATAALNVDWQTAVLASSERTGVWGWLVGGRTAKEGTVATEILFLTWPLLEIMFGFYFTKVDKQ